MGVIFVNRAVVPVDPLVSVTDNFNRADGALVGSTTSDGSYVWEQAYGDGTISVSSNSATINIFERAVYLSTPASDVDISIDAKLADANSQPAILFRYVDNNNWCRLEHQSGAGVEYKLTYTVAGVQTHFYASASRADTLNFHQMRVVAEGTNVKTYFDGVLKHDETITAHETATKHGIAMFSGGTRIDNFLLTYEAA